MVSLRRPLFEEYDVNRADPSVNAGREGGIQPYACKLRRLFLIEIRCPNPRDLGAKLKRARSARRMVPHWPRLTCCRSQLHSRHSLLCLGL